MMIAAMACTFAFTSCGDDEDEPSGDLQCVMKYEVEFSDDWMKLCTVEVTYTDINGASQTEAMTSTTWSKNMNKKGDTLVPGSIKVVSTIKPDAKVDNEGKYDLVYNINGVTAVLKSNGVADKERKFGTEKKVGVPGLLGERVLDYLQKNATIHFESK